MLLRSNGWKVSVLEEEEEEEADEEDLVSGFVLSLVHPLLWDDA